MSKYSFLKQVDNKWQPCEIKDLRKGDMFRMKGIDGKLYIDDKGRDTRIASSDGYLDSDGVWKVKIDGKEGT